MGQPTQGDTVEGGEGNRGIDRKNKKGQGSFKQGEREKMVDAEKLCKENDRRDERARGIRRKSTLYNLISIGYS